MPPILLVNNLNLTTWENPARKGDAWSIYIYHALLFAYCTGYSLLTTSQLMNFYYLVPTSIYLPQNIFSFHTYLIIGDKCRTTKKAIPNPLMQHGKESNDGQKVTSKHRFLNWGEAGFCEGLQLPSGSSEEIRIFHIQQLAGRRAVHSVWYTICRSQVIR